MAILALKTTEQDADYRGTPVNDHGKMRYQFFDLPAVAVAGDAGTTIDLCELPPGRVRVIPSLSRVSFSAFGAARTMKIGHTAYPSRDIGAADPEPADDNAFTPDAIDVSAAVSCLPISDGVLKYDVYSKTEVLIQALIEGGTIPAGATLSGFIAYVYE